MTHLRTPILCQISTKLYYIETLSKNTQISNLMIICLVGAEMFHADGQNRHDKSDSRFPQFCDRT